MYNICKIFYLIAVCKPEAANTPDDERCAAKHVEPSVNVGIINSITRLHLVGNILLI